jgi:hypothetical protein
MGPERSSVTTEQSSVTFLNEAMRRAISRVALQVFFEKLAPTMSAIEACGASQHLARPLQSICSAWRKGAALAGAV